MTTSDFYESSLEHLKSNARCLNVAKYFEILKWLVWIHHREPTMLYHRSVDIQTALNYLEPINKINVVQKEAMAEFMDQYKDLARNFRNNKQGKQRMNKLWEELAQKLNARRPPVKDAKLWKKVFRDQKYIIKNKLTCKKRSKGQTGSGVFVEIPLTFAEEQIIEAARLEASVIGVDDAQTSELDEKSYSTISSIGQTWDLADKTQDTTPDFENASISIRSPLQKKGEYQTSLKEARYTKTRDEALKEADYAPAA
uniref:Regulatory protein zeste n=1 Tax=Glossina pallidipes TaxID=7398 RepID=A0A1A9Z589_GLOPL